jgi:hypothetical protein
MTDKYNFLKSQTNLNMYKLYIHTTHFHKKSYKPSKHTNKLNMPHKNTKKINILKIGFNKIK